MSSQIGACVTWDNKRCKASEFVQRAKLPANAADLDRVNKIPLTKHEDIPDIDNPELYEWWMIGNDKYGRVMYCVKTGIKRTVTMGEFYQGGVVD